LLNDVKISMLINCQQGSKNNQKLKAHYINANTNDIYTNLIITITKSVRIGYLPTYHLITVIMRN